MEGGEIGFEYGCMWYVADFGLCAKTILWFL